MSRPGHGDNQHAMAMREPPFPVEAAWVVATFVSLAIAIFVTDRFVPLRF